VRRPGPLSWFRYALLGRLPRSYSEWVLHDTTCSTWLLRHFARVLAVIAVPLVVLALAIPADSSLVALTVITVGACQVLLCGILANDMTERRASNAGYPWGMAERMRSERAVQAQRTANHRRRERVAARRARRFT
jgi:uncharacterized protein DUF5313